MTLFEIVKQQLDDGRRIGRIEARDPTNVYFIAETVLTGSAASVTFSSLPQQYRTLMLHIQARSDRVAEIDTVGIRFNADAGANYDFIRKWAQGGVGFSELATRGAGSGYAGIIEGASSTASNFAMLEIKIIGYSLADRHKRAFSWSTGVFGDISADSDLYLADTCSKWRNTAAITSITMFPSVGPNFVAGSRFTLYGIL